MFRKMRRDFGREHFSAVRKGVRARQEVSWKDGRETASCNN